MTHRPSISIFISRSVSLVLLWLCTGVGSLHAQGFLKYLNDSVPLFRGFAVSFDLVGAAQTMLGDYGQYEGALRLNLHDQYFPIVELGIGRASHEDDAVTTITYKTSAPYFRLGCDVNIARNKHSGNRIYAGLRYAFTSYKVDILSKPSPDPVWQWDAGYDVVGQRCSQHWAEVVFGLDAKVTGPLHLGWSVRYKRRLAHREGNLSKTWYVPGFGISDGTSLGATFNVMIDI